MEQLNNLDVVILIITAVSALIALCRGLVKEVLSIIGWVLAAVVVFYMLPILTPFAKNYIASSMMAGIVTALLILIVFYIIWLLSTDKMVSKIRTSKLSALDRILGLVFGVLRACLLVILFNILVTWMLPEESKEGMFKDSRYFNIAGRFAEPLVSLIPESTIDLIRDKSAEVGLGKEQSDKEDKDSASGKEQEQEQKQEQEDQKEIDELFEKLAQPQIEKAKKDIKEKAADFSGYKKDEADNLDRLIENVEDNE